MLSHEVIPPEKTIVLLPKDRKASGCICNYFIVQCILVFVGASTIQYCLWSPEHATHDYDKLARIMYLFDSQACGYNLRASRTISNLQLSDYTGGLDVLPIKWVPAEVTVSTRLTAKTRRYIELSIIFHVIWLLVAIGFKLMRDISSERFLKIGLGAFFYTSIFMVIFDLSMAIVYIAHIQQSLTKGMILRYSGWSVEMKLKNPDGFGGWLPMAASICWMRGVVFLAINIYCCRSIRGIRGRIKRREVKRKLILEEKSPIPEAKYEEPWDDKVLYFRTGEKKPFVRKPYRPLFFE
ncbi:uncharacterized protein [Epargyreus clarus]|uniref:uncharacterized protein n=1 Tax=Epargyreus clarus TaxID=520877 RepID=UPI003C2EE9C5